MKALCIGQKVHRQDTLGVDQHCDATLVSRLLLDLHSSSAVLIAVEDGGETIREVALPNLFRKSSQVVFALPSSPAIPCSITDRFHISVQLHSAFIQSTSSLNNFLVHWDRQN